MKKETLYSYFGTPYKMGLVRTNNKIHSYKVPNEMRFIIVRIIRDSMKSSSMISTAVSLQQRGRILMDFL